MASRGVRKPLRLFSFGGHRFSGPMTDLVDNGALPPYVRQQVIIDIWNPLC
jgi:hypothetical protein